MSTQISSTTASGTAAAPDAVVVGGGIAGLLAAYRLAHDGARVTIVEARTTVGGAVAAHELHGQILDAGAESFAVRGGHVAALLEELGLAEDVVAPNPAGAWVLLPQGPRELPRTGVLGIPANPWDPEVRRTLGLYGSLRASLDALLPGSWGSGVGVSSVSRLVQLRQGKRVLKRLVEPVVGGVHAADPALLDIDMVAPGLRKRLASEGSLARAVRAQREAGAAAAQPSQRSTGNTGRAGSAVGGIVGGLHRLVTALEAKNRELGVSFRLNETAQTLSRANSAWLVQTSRGALEAEHLVVALDGPAAVDLLATAVPGADAYKPAAGAQIALVTLVVDAPELDPAPRGTGILVAPQSPGVQAKALTHASSKWPWLAQRLPAGTHVLRLSYGRAQQAGAVSAGNDPATRSDEQLFHAALHDANALLSVQLSEAQVLDHDVVRWNGALPFAAVGHRDRVNRVRELCAEFPGLSVVGAWLAGTGLAAVVKDTNEALAAKGTASSSAQERFTSPEGREL